MSNDTKEDTVSPASSKSTTRQLDDDDEFFDADDGDVCGIDKLTLDNKPKPAEPEAQLDAPESKFIPLHEELNQKQQLLAEKAKEDEDEEKDLVDQEPIDAYFVDEEELKSKDESMSDEEKQEKLAEAIKFKQEGNELFKAESFHEALELYTRALQTCPYGYAKERAVFYSNRAICFFKMKDNERCIKECATSIQLDPTFVKPLLRRADCLESADKLDEALEDYKKLAELEPAVTSHKRKCYELEEKIKERNEKLKTEMMGKLKDLGNMVLKPFGLSTSNFEFVQDPNTGSYSVNFKK